MYSSQGISFPGSCSLAWVAPFSPLLFHQVAILPLLFTVAFPFAAFLSSGIRTKRYSSSSSRLYSAQPKADSSCPKAAAPFSWGNFIYWMPMASKRSSSSAGTCAPHFPRSSARVSCTAPSNFRMSSASDMICDPVWHESTPFLVPQSLLLSRLTGADITSGKCLHRISVNKVIARNGLRLPAAISKY